MDVHSLYRTTVLDGDVDFSVTHLQKSRAEYVSYSYDGILHVSPLVVQGNIVLTPLLY